jgi:hypothetical protein
MTLRNRWLRRLDPYADDGLAIAAKYRCLPFAARFNQLFFVYVNKI